jgi:hypothetical protein
LRSSNPNTNGATPDRAVLEPLPFRVIGRLPLLPGETKPRLEPGTLKAVALRQCELRREVKERSGVNRETPQ